MTTEMDETAFRMDRLGGLMNTIRRKTKEFEEYLDTLPTCKKCERHPQTVAVLNRESSISAGSAVWDCPVCMEEARVARVADRISAAGIPADVWHATIDNFNTARTGQKTGKGFSSPRSFLGAAALWRSCEIRNVFFCGTPGIGKGHLAAALVIERIKQGKSVAWVEASRLFKEYHAAYETNANDEVVARYVSRNALVLDEVAFRDLPADGEEIMFAIIDGRQKAGRQTILLGNKNADDTKRWLGGRVTDRLRSGGVAFCYGEWDSMRGADQDGATGGF